MWAVVIIALFSYFLDWKLHLGFGSMLMIIIVSAVIIEGIYCCVRRALCRRKS
jgi:hypothetical protein